MTIDYREQVEDLLADADNLPECPSKLALLEEAVRIADVHQDAELGDEVREELIQTATFSGYPEKALTAFSWRLAQADRSPDLFPEERLMWSYKWIAGSLTSFPQITREQIEAAFDDMTVRFARCGYGMRSIHKLRWETALDMGEPEEVRRYYRLWTKTSRDANSDCIACEQDSRVLYYAYFDKNEKAVQAARPILNGSMSCATVPERTYGRVLLPLLQLGQVEQAAEYHRLGYRLIRGNREYLDYLGDHLTFLGLTGNYAQGVKLFEKHLSWALDTMDLFARWQFYLAARIFFSLVAESGQTSLKLRLPKETPGYQEDGCYEVAQLFSMIDEHCRDLAARFDARNGNDSFTCELADQHKLKRWATKHPLQRSRRGD
jgi:hypothetical protein